MHNLLRAFKKGNRTLPEILTKIVRYILSQRVNMNWTKKINGYNIKIPIIYGIGYRNISMREVWMIDLLKNLPFRNKGAFFDVGVNLGQTLLKVKCVDPDIEYIGFEPNPVCVFYTKELIKINHFNNCLIIPIGLFDVDGLLPLEFNNETEFDASASLIKDFRPNHNIYHKQYVPVFSFESIKSSIKYGNVSVIKIDVEGSELEVMKSFLGLISKFRPIIIIEILPIYSNEREIRKERQEKIEELLSDLNYSIFRIIKAVNGSYQGLKELKTIGVHSDLNQCDYVFVPYEMKNEILGIKLRD